MQRQGHDHPGSASTIEYWQRHAAVVLLAPGLAPAALGHQAWSRGRNLRVERCGTNHWTNIHDLWSRPRGFQRDGSVCLVATDHGRFAGSRRCAPSGRAGLSEFGQARDVRRFATYAAYRRTYPERSQSNSLQRSVAGSMFTSRSSRSHPTFFTRSSRARIGIT